MLFDKFLKIVETNPQHFKGLTDQISKLKLFIFDGVAQNVLPETNDNPDFIQKFWQMPFPAVAIEDNASLIVLIDKEEDQKGLGETRLAIELLSTKAATDVFDKREIDPELVKKMEDRENSSEFLNADEEFVLSFGVIEKVELCEDGKKYGCFGFMSFLYHVEADFNAELLINIADNKNFSQEIKENYELGRDALLRNVATALQELIYFSGAKRFILETSPKKKRKNPKKALRSHERETYTMLLPSEIREKMGIDQVKSGTKVTPHERRRHLRVLRAESWGDRQGDVVNVKASWVGKSENIVGKKIYKVRLDI